MPLRDRRSIHLVAVFAEVPHTTANILTILRTSVPWDIRLTSHSNFIRGMDFHLSQQFDDAINNWLNGVALAQRKVG